ncbi:RagB/SusD family nutrient uptake outer membrane protein [uncultured Pontibacter sp.]|uniref:RagB/SusD family nutrient uptake outer membrane protein n=1 Tax=uncultured Pontibacter sp. TaxID=453356 RepID=UPI002609746D|nr:RagB/SusD family nutrient uptake outer membrane protein [uncultured Pontibacter sp.]
MNKKIKHHVIVSLLSGSLALTTVACGVIEKEPVETLSPEAVFSSPERIEKAVIGIYDNNQHPSFLGGRALIYADIRGGDTDPASYFGGIGLFNTLSNDGTVTAAWTGGYSAIYGANLFLEALEANRSKVATELLAKQYEAEAKFIRALNHWYLVNLFAQPYTFTSDASHMGIPVALKAFDATSAFSPEAQLPRSTVAKVYEDIEKDLLFGEVNLPASHGADFSNVARATKGAATALLMRLYLYKGDHDKAIAYADKVTALGYDLNAVPLTAFRSYMTEESIFSVAHNAADNPNTNSSIGMHYSPDNRGDISISPYYRIPTLSDNDLRKSTLTTAKLGKSWTLKYTDATNWIPVIRYPEVILTKAEALAKKSATPNPEAVELLNQLRRRAQATEFTMLDFSSKEELIDTILLERRIELAFEGHGMFDLLRNKKDIPASEAYTLQPYGSNRTILPIPQVDIQANPNLKQNPGY